MEKIVLKFNPRFINSKGFYGDETINGKNWVPLIDRRGTEYVLSSKDYMNAKSWEGILLSRINCVVVIAEILFSAEYQKSVISNTESVRSI